MANGTETLDGPRRQGRPEPKVTMSGQEVGLLLRSRNARFAILAVDKTVRRGFFTQTDLSVLENGRAVFTLRLSKSNGMALAENGYTAFSCYKSLSRLKSNFIVLTPSGSVAFQKDFNALGHSVGISPNGLFAAFQSANSPSRRDSSVLVLLDVTTGEIIFKRHDGDWADYYEWDEEHRIVTKRYCPQDQKDRIVNVPY